MIKYRVKMGFVAVAIVAILFCASNYLFSHVHRAYSNEIYLNDGWHIEGNTVQGDDVTLSKLVFKALNRGDTICYSVILPDVAIENPVVKFYAVHSAINVYFDNQLIYEYGHDRYQKNRILGYGIQLLNIPQNFAGKELKIEYLISENQAFSRLEIPVLGNGVELMRGELIKLNTPIAISFFLFLSGVALIVAGSMLSFMNGNFKKLICIGAFSIGAAIWTFCKYDAIFYFTRNALIKVYMEYLSLYFLPIPVIFYFYDEIHDNRNKRCVHIYDFLLYSHITYFIVVCALQFTNLIHMPAFLYGEHALLITSTVFMMGMYLHDLFHKKYEHVALIIGMGAMLSSALVDVVLFDLQKNVESFQKKYYISILCVGTMVFVFLQIIDFGIDISKKVKESVETLTLQKLAYTDALTGIANRRKCEDEFEKVEKSNNNYGIFSFDLNHLKETNDTLGHEAGDNLIKTFADILKSVFKESAIVGRMGGDEFIAIIPNIDYVDKNQLVRDLEEAIARHNKENPEIIVSTAYGFCEKIEERNMNVSGIYRQADERMYNMKINMRENRK